MSLQGINITLKTALVALGLLLCTALAAATENRNLELVAAVPENFPPYYLLDSNGQPAGFAIETLTRIADIAGLRIRYLVTPDWESTMDALRRGDADLIPNLGITPGRLEHFAFTAPLETFGLGLFVRSVNTGIHGMDDLEGKTAAVVNGNAAVKWLQDYPRLPAGNSITRSRRSLPCSRARWMPLSIPSPSPGRWPRISVSTGWSGRQGCP